jgi:hypothetical protein
MKYKIFTPDKPLVFESGNKTALIMPLRILES